MLLSIWIGLLMFALVPQILPVKGGQPCCLYRESVFTQPWLE